MSTFFLDPSGGNDSSDGTTFANRWKTITDGATAARIGPGDTIRIIASPAASSVGDATWTNKDDDVALAGALNITVNLCNTAWTGSANVTAATSTTRKEGTTSASMAIAAGFTTGLVAYSSTVASDYSTDQQLTFWIRTSIDTAASTFKISLCSDGAGATPVDDFTITDALKANVWTPFCINKGSALGASIGSVALYALLDPGTNTVLLDDILSVKAATSANALSLVSLIGKNTAGDGWWGIRSINGTAVKLDSGPNSTFTTTPRGYSGTTETVTTYRRECFRTAPATSPGTAVQTVLDSGTSGNQITFSGGWNPNDSMESQSGETWYDGGNGNGYGLLISSKNFITVSKLAFVRYYQGIEISGSSSFVFDSPGLNNCQNVGFNGTFTSIAVRPTISSIQTNANEVDGLDIAINGSQISMGSWTALSNGGVGVSVTSTGQLVTQSGTLKCKNNTSHGAKTSTGGVFDTVNVADNAQHGFLFQSCRQKTLINSFTSTSNTSSALTIDAPMILEVKTWTSSGNGSNIGVNLSSISGILNAVINNATISETTKASGFISFSGQTVTFSKIGGNVDSNETYFDGGNIKSVTTNRHTASGKAWQVNVTDSTIRSSYDYPITLPVSVLGVGANTLATLSAWIKRSSSTAINARLRIVGGWVAGVPTDVTTSATGATDTYQEETVTCTPTEEGVLDLMLDVYSSTSNVDSVYIDDCNLSQA